MNGRVFAALFVAIFLAGALPMLLVQPAGAASALLTVGFIVPVSHPLHILALIMIGIFSSRLSSDPILLVPLSAVLMISIGAMLQLDPRQFPAMHAFVGGSIVLFSLSVSLLRRGVLLSILPIAVWAYYAGGSYMAALPADITPAYFLIGIMLSVTLAVAIGVSLGTVLESSLDYSVDRLRAVPRMAMLLALF